MKQDILIVIFKYIKHIRDLKIDGAVLKCMNKKSFLRSGNCNKRLKFILVACKQFCLAK